MTYDDDDLGRQLEQVLRGEADTVQPIGDGLQLIRRKIERRRSRRRLIVPLTGIAGIAAVGTIAYAVFGGTDPDRLNQATPAVTNTATGSPTATPSPSPTSTDGLAIADDPSLAIWPFAHASDAGSWTKDGTNGWMASQKLVAQKFVETFGGKLGSSVYAEQPILEGGEIIVPVSRKVDNGPTIEVALVHLHQWASGPLSVVAVTEPDRAFTNLNPADTLNPGQVIRGIHHTEDLYTLNVYEAAGTKSIGSARSAAISGTEWSAKVDFSTQAPLGSVVATDASPADGGLGAMIAVPVQFGTGGTGAPSATPTPTGTAGGLPGYMTTIVGTKDGRVAYFGTASGAFKGYLTGQTAGGGDSAPSMSPDRQWVYFLRGTGTCANEIARVPFPGGGEANVEVVQKPSNGYVFDTMSAGAGGSVTWIERNCANDQNLALGWAGAAHNSSGRIAVAGGPPTFTGTPRLSPDASKVAVLFVSGMLHSIQVYDVTAAKAIGDTLPGGCTATDGCQGIDFDWAPDGSFVVLTDPSGVVRVVPGAKTAVPLFAGQGVIGSRLDLSKDGSGLLVWDAQANAVTVFTVDANRAVPADKTVTGTGLPTW